MNAQRLFLLLIIIFLLLLYKPSGIWAELRRTWRMRDSILRVLVAIIGLYLLYGVFQLYMRGDLTWLTDLLAY
jgi:hypothetical protein